MLKIVGFLKSQSGCDWYRILQPLTHLKVSKQAEVVMFHKGDDFDWFASEDASNTLEKMFSWGDILFVPRLSELRLIEVLREYQKMGKKIVTEWDDNIFQVSPLCQQYSKFGIEPYSHEVNGEKIDFWIDRKDADRLTPEKRKEAEKRGLICDFDLNRENLELAKEGMRMADLVMVTTPELADIMRPYNESVSVGPNSININQWKKLPLKPRSGLRVGWFGGDTHYMDWLMISPIIKVFLERTPNATLVLMGSKFDGTLKGINPQQIEHHPGIDILAYPYKSAILDLDFAVIPLEDTAFNRGKSPIKWLEMASLEVPAVTSYVVPYKRMMDLVPENGIFVHDNDLNSWYDGLHLISRDNALRKRMGQAARQTVEQFYDANKTWKIWLKAFEDMMAKKPIENKIPLEVSR
jgi:glycosyltransferase involved in cell wall biosynthesis